MKKVAIVTPEALAPRSFLWDEEAKRFKVRTNNLEDNSITQHEDGLHILGEEGVVISGVDNDLGRYFFTKSGLELPHMSMAVTDSTSRPLFITPKVSMSEMVFQLSRGEEGVVRSAVYNAEPGRGISMEFYSSCRVSYIHSGTIVVMDIFVPLVEGNFQFGFVDVLINAKTADFPTNGGGVGVIPTDEVPREPIILT